MIYSLKVLAGDRLAQKGTVVKGDCAPLTVGQCSDADVKITNDSPWEDANCFVVLKNDGFEGWHLARISRNVDLKVNGIPVDRIRYLHEKDIISCGRIDFRFDILKSEKDFNGKYEIIQSSIKRLWFGVACAFLLLSVSLASYVVSQNRNREIKAADLVSLEASIYRITVPYALLQEKQDDGSIVTRDSIPVNTSGTCFVTDEGFLVTARHCIEPWLNESCPDELRLAASHAITESIMSDDPQLRILCAVDVIDGGGNVIRYYSSEFKVNTDRDIIVNEGTRQAPLYMRRIHPSYHRRDCALGDIAVLKGTSLPGRIELATAEILKGLKEGDAIIVKGFEKSSVSHSKAASQKGEILHVPGVGADGIPDDGIMQNDPASSGDSGGPVFIRKHGHVYAISVYSRRDDYRRENSGWSVPVTELKRMKCHEQGE